MREDFLENYINKFWDEKVLPKFKEYISIPCVSTNYDLNWKKNGYLKKAAELFANFAKQQKISGIKTKILENKNYPPLLFIDIPGNINKTALFYGHLDKMPSEAKKWSEGLNPYRSVIKNNKLYGRGTVDDGYAFFSALSSIMAVREKKASCPRCVILIECGEESESPGFDKYIDILKNKIGNPDIFICLDNQSGDCEHLWCTTSLRGLLLFDLSVEILKIGAHSGYSGGVVPESFTIIRQLLDKIENSKTGEVLLKSCKVKIPKERITQAKEMANIVGQKFYSDFPFIKNVQPIYKNVADTLINRTWRSSISYVGADGIPSFDKYQIIVRPKTVLRMALRLPPNCEPKKVELELKRELERNAPYNSKVSLKFLEKMPGWNAFPLSYGLDKIVKDVSIKYFGKKAAFVGGGGSIGIILMLSKKFPKTQFLLFGADTLKSNAHGPNEYLYLPFAKKISCCTAYILTKL